MNDLQALIEQMVSDISSQMLRLDDLRLGLFLDWLGAHNSRMKVVMQPNEPVEKKVPLEVVVDRYGNFEEQFKTNLGIWFESLPMTGLSWECHLILDEIAWWVDLDPQRLKMILKSEAGI